MAGKSAWSKNRKEKQGSNWPKARKAEEERIKAHPNSQNVSLGAHNGHSVNGYTIEPKTNATKDRRAASDAAKAKRAAKRVAAQNASAA